MLAIYPHTYDKEILSQGFEIGFRLGYSGPRRPRLSDPLPSVRRNPSVAADKILKEAQAGRIAGPFHSPPFPTLQCSPIGLVEKQEKGTYRMIHNLSHPVGASINELLSVVKYTSFDSAVDIVSSMGTGALLAKTDIKSAFRLLPIYPGDFDLLGFTFNGQYYFDKMLPMGASISCSLFEKFSTFLDFSIKRITKSDGIVHYLDDFLFTAKGHTNDCERLLTSFQGMCDQLGVPLAPEKTVAPKTVLCFLGLEIDSVRRQVRIPSEKLMKLKAQLRMAMSSRELKVRQAQSLVGSLNFVCRAVAPGRTFLRRLIDLTKGRSDPEGIVHVGKGAKEDLSMWLTFLDGFNGISFFESWCGRRVRI